MDDRRSREHAREMYRRHENNKHISEQTIALIMTRRLGHDSVGNEVCHLSPYNTNKLSLSL
jgi:hypothetical protein